MKTLLQSLPERKRRTFMRYMNKKAQEDNSENNKKNEKDELLCKLNALKKDDFDYFSDLDFDDSENGSEDALTLKFFC